MTLLRQVDRPGSQASWTEQLYDRSYKVVNGEVDVENPTHINLLKGRGFKEVTEELNLPTTSLGKVYYGGKPVEEVVPDQVDVSEETVEPKVEPQIVNYTEIVSDTAPSTRGRGRGRPPKKTQQGVN